jgi:hypothetical protein
MTDHSGLLDRYRHVREVRFRLNKILVKSIPKETLQECGRILGLFRNGTFVFDSEDESSLLMDYCLYYPQPDGRNLVATYLEKSQPAADSVEMAVLQAMTHAYYSLFQVVDVEPGIGVSVQDLLRDESGFIVDIGFGNTARRHLMLATRIIPEEGFLMTSGAALPVEATAARRIVDDLNRNNQNPETFNFKQISPAQEAELAALMIRVCRSSGMSARITYEAPGSPGRPRSIGSDVHRVGRNDRCPCGSGKKFKTCCGRS